MRSRQRFVSALILAAVFLGFAVLAGGCSSTQTAKSYLAARQKIDSGEADLKAHLVLGPAVAQALRAEATLMTDAKAKEKVTAAADWIDGTVTMVNAGFALFDNLKLSADALYMLFANPLTPAPPATQPTTAPASTEPVAIGSP